MLVGILVEQVGISPLMHLVGSPLVRFRVCSSSVALSCMHSVIEYYERIYWTKITFYMLFDGFRQHWTTFDSTRPL